MNVRVKAAVFWLVIVVSAFLLWQVVRNGPTQHATPEISYSQFVSQTEAGDVAKVTISKNQIYGITRNRSFRVTAPENLDGILLTLRQKNVEIWFKDAAKGDWQTGLMNVAPLFLLAALWLFMIRQMKARQAQSQIGGATESSDNRWTKR